MTLVLTPPNALEQNSKFESDMSGGNLPAVRADEAILKEAANTIRSELEGSAPANDSMVTATSILPSSFDQGTPQGETNVTVNLFTRPDANVPGSPCIDMTMTRSGFNPGRISIPLSAELNQAQVDDILTRFNTNFPEQTSHDKVRALLNGLKNANLATGRSALKNLGISDSDLAGLNLVGSDFSPTDPDKSKIEHSKISNWDASKAKMGGRIFDSCVIEGLDVHGATMQGVAIIGKGTIVNMRATNTNWDGGHISSETEIKELDVRGASLRNFTYGNRSLIDFITNGTVDEVKKALNGVIYDDSTRFSDDPQIQAAILAKLEQCSVEVTGKLMDKDLNPRMVFDKFTSSSLINTLEFVERNVMSVAWRDGSLTRLQMDADAKTIKIVEVPATARGATDEVVIRRTADSDFVTAEMAAEYLTWKIGRTGLPRRIGRGPDEDNNKPAAAATTVTPPAASQTSPVTDPNNGGGSGTGGAQAKTEQATDTTGNAGAAAIVPLPATANAGAGATEEQKIPTGAVQTEAELQAELEAMAAKLATAQEQAGPDAGAAALVDEAGPKVLLANDAEELQGPPLPEEDLLAAAADGLDKGESIVIVDTGSPALAAEQPREDLTQADFIAEVEANQEKLRQTMGPARRVTADPTES